MLSRSEEELRALMGYPVAVSVVDKTLSRLDRHCLTFISRSPFVFDTLRNFFQSPRVGLIFLIPGKRETLRIGVSGAEALCSLGVVSQK